MSAAQPAITPWPPALARRYRELGLWRGQALGVWFEQSVARHDTRTAVVAGSRRISYAELGHGARSISNGLSHLGVTHGDRVVLQLSNGLELLEVLFALLRLGAVPVLARPAHRRAELEAFCARSRASAMIIEARHDSTDLLPMASAVRESCPSLKHVIVHGPLLDFAGEFSSLEGLRTRGASLPDVPVAQVSAAELALLQLSRGSHAIPKLIPRSHDDYLYSVRASAELCELSEHTRYLATLPMTHNFALSSPGVLGTLHMGGCVVTCAQPSPEAVFGLLVNEGITLTAALPSMVRSWLDARTRHARAIGLEQLTLQVGGAKLEEPLARTLRKTLGCRLQQVYGMAEGLVNYTRLDAPEELIVTTQGRPLSAHDEIRIVDPLLPEGPELPAGVVGELQTRGPYTIRGYYDDRASDARHFTSDGFFRTADLVRRTAAGDLVVEGRLAARSAREKPMPDEGALRRHVSLA